MSLRSLTQLIGLCRRCQCLNLERRESSWRQRRRLLSRQRSSSKAQWELLPSSQFDPCLKHAVQAKSHSLMSRPRRGDNPVKSVVHGYLGQFGTVAVAHTQPIAHITPTKGEPSTVVLSILATKSTIKQEEWAMIRKCTVTSAVLRRR